MNVIIDMNLSPEWVPYLAASGIQATSAELEQGALATVDPRKNRVHLLPLKSS